MYALQVGSVRASAHGGSSTLEHSHFPPPSHRQESRFIVDKRLTGKWINWFIAWLLDIVPIGLELWMYADFSAWIFAVM